MLNLMRSFQKVIRKWIMVQKLAGDLDEMSIIPYTRVCKAPLHCRMKAARVFEQDTGLGCLLVLQCLQAACMS